MIEKVECPQCHKMVKSLGQHKRFCPSDKSLILADPALNKSSLGGSDQPSYDRAIEALMATIGQQQKIIQEQGAKLEAMGKSFSEFAGSVVEKFNEVPKTVSMAMRSEIDQLEAEAQGRMQRAQGEPGSSVPSQQPTTGAPSGGMMSQLFPILAQAFANSLTGGGQNNPMAAFQQIAPMVQAMQAIAQMQMAPFVAGGKMVADMITLGTKSGLSAEESAKAAGHVMGDMAPKQETK